MMFPMLAPVNPYMLCASSPHIQKLDSFLLLEEIKSFVQTGVTGMGLYLERLEQSRQLEHPYGWVVAYIKAGPPDQTTH